MWSNEAVSFVLVLAFASASLGYAACSVWWEHHGKVKDETYYKATYLLYGLMIGCIWPALLFMLAERG
jgi:hypothetical protein